MFPFLPAVALIDVPVFLAAIPPNECLLFESGWSSLAQSVRSAGLKGMGSWDMGEVRNQETSVMPGGEERENQGWRCFS